MNWERVDGFYFKDEARLLRECCTGSWCEVGCYMGRSTVVLAETGHEGWAVDWCLGSPEMGDIDTFEVLTRNLEPYENVTLLAMRFEEAAPLVPGGLTLVHLDADHSYEATRSVIDLYAPKVAERGVLAVHDAYGGAWPGVEEAAGELRSEWKRIGLANRLVVYERR